MEKPGKEKGYQKYAWVLLVLGGLLDLFGAISYWAQNGWTLPAPEQFVIAPFFIVFGIVQIALGPTAFRRGAKWAWYIILIGPLGSLLNTVYDSLGYTPLLSFLFFFYGGPALLGLLLSYRKFFPKKQLSAA